MGRKACWRSLWRLAATILSSCFLLTEGQSTPTQILIRLQPEHPIEGQEVTLIPEGPFASVVTYRWYRGLGTEENNWILTYYILPSNVQDNGTAFTGRETGGPEGTLRISKLISKDTGNYTLIADIPGNTRRGSASLVVSVFLPKPTVSASPGTFLKEFTDSVQLTCQNKSEYADVRWLWNGGPLNSSSRIQLSDDGWILDIWNIIRSDAGMYQCQVSNLVSNETSDILYIDVIYGPDTLVIQPDKASYNVHSDIKLNCTASSVPGAHYSWFLNEKNVVNGTELLLRNVNQEHSGNYTCQATNELTHRTESTTLEIEVVGDVYDVTIAGPTTAIENWPVKLNCTSVGPNVSYSWFKGDQLMEPGVNINFENNNQTLIFNRITRNDTANYTCCASNGLSSNSSEPHWLEIFYGPDAPIINPQDTVYSVGSNLSLSCFANSNPPAMYSWYHNEERLKQQNTSELLIWNLSWPEEGNYICNATNDVTGLSNDASLKISFEKPVTIVTISGPDKVIEQNVTVLSCSSDGTNASYYWLKENQSPEILQHISLSNDTTLTFNPTTRDDSGTYTCYGYNSFSNASANYTLDVFYGPDVPIINPSNTTQYYAEGTTLNLSCEAVSNPPAQYTWLFNDSVVIENQSQLLRNYLNLSDSGNYTCQAFNNETNRFNDSLLEIYVLKNLTIPILESTPNGMVKENTTVTLKCNTSNSPDVSVFWFKDGKPLPDGAGLSNGNRTLTLSNVTKRDTGLYSCKASNFVSNQESSPVNITVAYGPVVKLNPEGPIEKSLNSDLKLECIADSVPAAQFQWFFNNVKRDENGSIFQVRLSNWTDEGNYSCQATNPFTSDSAMITAYVKLTEGSGGDSSNNNSLSGGAIAGIVIGCIAGVVLISGLLYFICTKTSFGRTELHASNGNVPSAPGRNQGVTDTKPKAAEEDLQYSILAFKDTNRSPPPRPTSEVPQPSDNITIYSEIKKK